MFYSCLWLVYTGLEFILLCYVHCFRHSPNVSSKVGVEFILVVLYIDGLSSFFIFHQTQNISTMIKVLPFSCKAFHMQTSLCFLVFVTPYIITYLPCFNHQYLNSILWHYISPCYVFVRDPSLEIEKPDPFPKAVPLLPRGWPFHSLGCDSEF